MTEKILKTLQLRVKDKHSSLLKAMARNVNMVWLYFQTLPLTTWNATELLTPYLAPKAANVIPESLSERKASASSGVSFFARFGFDRAVNSPDSLACSWLRLREVHSRLVAALLVLSRFLWFTSGKSLDGRNAAATSRCNLPFMLNPRPQSVTNRYPSLSTRGFNTLPRLTATPPQRCPTSRSRLRTRPSELTSYAPNVPATGNQISSMLHYAIRSSYCAGLRTLVEGAAS